MKLTIKPCAGEPELCDPVVTAQFAEQMAALAATEQVPPWCGYIGWQGTTPMGFGGFVSPPDAAGSVEIGYLTFPAHEGKGVATAIAGEMIVLAARQGALHIIAHTLPEENASTSVLRRNGFSRDGVSIDPDEGEVWKWVCPL